MRVVPGDIEQGARLQAGATGRAGAATRAGLRWRTVEEVRGGTSGGEHELDVGSGRGGAQQHCQEQGQQPLPQEGGRTAGCSTRSHQWGKQSILSTGPVQPSTAAPRTA